MILKLEEKENIPENTMLMKLRRGNTRLRELGIASQVPGEGQKKVPKRIQKWALLEQYLGRRVETRGSPDLTNGRNIKLRITKKGGTANKDQQAPFTSLKTHLRNMIIVPEMIGTCCAVYNGKVFNMVDIKPEMVGFYLGEFSITYRPVRHGRPGLGSTNSSRFIPLK